MNAILAALLVALAKAAPDAFVWIADLIRGGTLPEEAEVEKRIAAIESASKTMDAEEDAIFPGTKEPVVISTIGGALPANKLGG